MAILVSFSEFTSKERWEVVAIGTYSMLQILNASVVMILEERRLILLGV